MEFDRDLAARQEARTLSRQAEAAQRILAEYPQEKLDEIERQKMQIKNHQLRLLSPFFSINVHLLYHEKSMLSTQNTEFGKESQNEKEAEINSASSIVLQTLKAFNSTGQLFKTGIGSSGCTGGTEGSVHFLIMKSTHNFGSIISRNTTTGHDNDAVVGLYN